MKIIFTLLFAIICFNLGAQEDKTSNISRSFQFDMGMKQIKEENIHPKVHHGLLYTLKYEHAKQSRNISAYTIGLGYSRLKTKYEDLSASANLLLQCDYHYLFEIKNKNKYTYHLGPEINLVYDLSYYPNWDESHLYWASCLDLGIQNKFNFNISYRQSLAVDIGFNLFSIFSRPTLDRQYKIDDISLVGIMKNINSNLETGMINKSFLLAFKVEYQFHTCEKITQAICYSYNYRRVKSIEGFPLQNNLHKIGFKIYF